MSHLALQVMQKILGGDGGAQEVEKAAEHMVSCESCRTLAATLIDELRAETPDLQGGGPLRLVFDLIEQERQWAMEPLTAMAEWSAVQKLPSRKSQRDRVRMAKACHTIAFFDLVFGEIEEAPAWDQAEFLASLALLSVEGMNQRQLTQAGGSDLQAKVWTSVANARRRAAEWTKAHQALANAERLLKAGTGDPRLDAGLLSITASTLADEGHVPKALMPWRGAGRSMRTSPNGLFWLVRLFKQQTF